MESNEESAFKMYKGKTKLKNNKKSKEKNINRSTNVIQKGVFSIKEKQLKEPTLKKINVQSNGISKKNKKPKNLKNKKQLSAINVNLEENEHGQHLQDLENKFDFTINSSNSISNGNTIMTKLSSIEQGREMLAWMIYPKDVNEFINKYWEKRPVIVSRDEPSYYKKLLNSATIDTILRKETIMFSKNIDITSYENDTRETHNPIGRALPHIVWDYYENGCSVRFLNPQTYIREVHLLNATLQDYFNCFVGANVYLTPPNSQGFAPHYDDIEAFVLQIEGKKLWKIYAPRSEEERLPRFSSNNFKQNEIGKPIMEVELKAGDCLYFPRGYIHQAVTVENQHSLHITVSTYQKHTWGDLFQKMIPKALEIAFLKDIDFRKGIPFDLFQHIGITHYDSNNAKRNEIIEQIKKLFAKLCDYLPFDYASDQLNKSFIHDALPPVLEKNEKELTVFGSNSEFSNGVLKYKVKIELNTRISLLRANILRLVEEDDDNLKIYYTIENSKEFHGNDLQYFEIDELQAVGVSNIIKAYPEYIMVKDLEIEDESMKIELVATLWEKGLLCIENPCFS